MVSLERTLKMTVEHLLQFFSYPPHRDIEVGLICELHKDTLLVMSNA